MFRPSDDEVHPTMSFADFCMAITVDLSTVSWSFNTIQTSRGKIQNFHCVSAGFIKRTSMQMEDFMVTCPLVSSTSHLISDSCSSPRNFGLGFLQPSPHDDNLALLLAFGSANTWQEDFHLSSFVPCPAHTFELCGANEAQRSLRPNERLVIWRHAH